MALGSRSTLPGRRGHELLLVVREGVRRCALRRARCGNARAAGRAYRDDIATHWDDYRELFDAARTFRPDATRRTGGRNSTRSWRTSWKDVSIRGRVGMSGRLYPGDPYLATCRSRG